jgi:xylulokinase
MLIGLDLGTTAIKGVLTDISGDIVAEAITETALRTPQPGWVEIDPDQHYESVCQVIRQLADSAGGEVTALAMAAASGNTLLTDAQGAPLGPIISWMDSRSSGIDMAASELARITGWPCIDSFPLAHLSWLQEHEPELYHSAGPVGMDTDWLLFRLTGLWRLDYSSATPFHLVDQVARKYHKTLLERLEIPEAKLSTLTHSGAFIGSLTEQAAEDTGLSAETMIVAGSFDHPAAARAAGVTAPGQLMLSCGTSWVGFLPHADRDAILDAELLCDPFLSADGGPWAGMFSLPQIGRTIDWYMNKVGGKATFNALADGADSAGLTIDLREPRRMPDANFARIARAVMEGAARLLREKILELNGHGMTFERAVMVGGASRSSVWPGIVADITGLEISVAGRAAGARGAAMIAKGKTL